MIHYTVIIHKAYLHSAMSLKLYKILKLYCHRLAKIYYVKQILQKKLYYASPMFITSAYLIQLNNYLLYPLFNHFIVLFFYFTIGIDKPPPPRLECFQIVTLCFIMMASLNSFYLGLELKLEDW